MRTINDTPLVDETDIIELLNYLKSLYPKLSFFKLYSNPGYMPELGIQKMIAQAADECKIVESQRRALRAIYGYFVVE